MMKINKIGWMVCFGLVTSLLSAGEPDTKWAYKDSNGAALFMDVFLPEGYEQGENYPTFVVFHGGSWRTGKTDWHYPDCEYWRSRGMIAVSVDYRLKDRDNVEVPLECVKDAKSSIRFLRKNAIKLKVNPNKIVVAGGSAGGQLAAALATINSVETNDDQYDLTVSCRPNLVLLYNPYFKTKPELNPSNFVTAGLPPFITFLGDNDPAIPVADILGFHNKLIEAGGQSEYYVGHGGKHGLCNGRNKNNKFFYWSTDLTDAFLVKQGILKGASKVVVPAGVAVLKEGEDYDAYTSTEIAQNISSNKSAGRPEKPNVILLLTDDLGWQDVGCYDIDKPTPMETPNIDKLAKKGVKFWQGYSPAPTCAPTRCAILSGNHPARAQKTHVVGGHPPAPHHVSHPMMPPWYMGRMPEGTYSLGVAMQDAGYVTGHAGKWHVAINHAAYPQPKDCGFDYTWSSIGTTKKMSPHRLTGFATDAPDDPYRIDEHGYTTHQNSLDAIGFVEDNKDKAFFLYYCTWLVHTPIHTRNKALLDKYVEKLGVTLPVDDPASWTGEGQTNPFYCAMVEELDYYVGQLFNYLDNTDDPRWPGHKLSENTYVVFTSDNGGMEKHPGEIITDNYPLDRGKISAMEGGTRVPFIVVGPNIPAGVESDVLVNGLDFYPTFLSWAGVEIPDGKNIDGCDLSSMLMHGPDDASLVRHADGSVRDSMMWHFPNSVALESTLRIGDYKLVRNYNHLMDQRTVELELYQLYNTVKGKSERVDIEEAKNLAASMPEKAKAMNQELTHRLESMEASYPYYNPNTKFAVPHKEKVCEVLSHEQKGNVVHVNYKSNGAKIKRADLMYTLNGGEKYEEWFRKKSVSLNDSEVRAELPEGTTHYVVNLIDENQFLRSYPELLDQGTLRQQNKKYSDLALKVN